MSAIALDRPAELQPAVPDLARIRRAWRRHLEREHAPATVETYMRVLSRFQTWLDAQDPPITLAAATAEDVRAWREQLRRRYALSSVSLYLAAIRAFYSWAIARGAPMRNPADGVKGRGRRRSTPHAREVLSDGEVLALLDSCAPAPGAGTADAQGRRDRAIVALAAYCGLRAVEIQRAQVGDLETRAGRTILWVWGKGRGEPDDFVVLPAAAHADLMAWLAHHPAGGGPLFCAVEGRTRGRPLSLRGLRAIWLRRARAIGIRSARKTFHSLRHSAISNAIRHGATPLQVQRMARHSDIKTTLGYYHETDRLTDPPEDRIDYSEEG